jgi:hypothetical protein
MADIYTRETYWTKESREALEAAYREWRPVVRDDWLIEMWMNEGLWEDEPCSVVLSSVSSVHRSVA